MPEELRVNGYIVSVVKEVEVRKTITTLSISLEWLKLSGFRGKVQVIDGLFDDAVNSDKVLFEIDV